MASRGSTNRAPSCWRVTTAIASHAAFSPDFYLPDQDLYVELTTMLPNQIRHKNRKIKRLRELYPEINVKLFKRGDIRSLMIKFGIEDPDMLHNEL